MFKSLYEDGYQSIAFELGICIGHTKLTQFFQNKLLDNGLEIKIAV